MDSSEQEAARAVAFRFLGYTARSRAEIEQRLARAGFGPEIVAAVVTEMEAQGWIDDAQLARDWVEDRADRKRYGRGRLAAELRRKGVDKDLVESALETDDEGAELERARVAARPKWRADALVAASKETIEGEKRRVASFLQRRGFAWDIITQVLSELMENQERLS